jgi:hypothetical protein
MLLLFFQGPLFAQTREQTKQNWWSEKPGGLYNVTTFSISPFRGPVLNGMQTIFGYKIFPQLAVGGGVGVERYVGMPTYDTLNANLSMLPIFADIRYTILKKGITPVIALNAGYKILLNIPSSQVRYQYLLVFPGMAWTEYYDYDEYNKGGFFITAEVGVKIPVYKRFGIYCSADYSVWKIAGVHHYWQYNYFSGQQGIIEQSYHGTDNTLAYVQAFLFRIGFLF